MRDKLGSYIGRLMTTILDKEQEQFVKDLAWSELKRLNADVEEFLRKHSLDDTRESEKTVKQLLQQDKKMSKISKDGYQQITIIKNALDAMYDKINNDFYVKDDSSKVRDIEKLYTPTNVFELVKDEFEAIAGIVNESGTWEEV